MELVPTSPRFIVCVGSSWLGNREDIVCWACFGKVEAQDKKACRGDSGKLVTFSAGSKTTQTLRQATGPPRSGAGWESVC